MRNTAAGRRNKKSEKGDHHCSRQNVRIASNVFKRRRINRFPKADSNDPIVRSGPFSPLRNILPKGVSPLRRRQTVRNAASGRAFRPLLSVLLGRAPAGRHLGDFLSVDARKVGADKHDTCWPIGIEGAPSLTRSLFCARASIHLVAVACGDF